MPILNCYVDDETMRRLDRASVDLDRKPTELAEASIAEAALDYDLGRARPGR